MKDDAFPISLKAHKTVMGQLEKGELSLDSDWKMWDKVRQHSVLSQTLNNLTSLSSKVRNVGNNANNSKGQSSSNFNSNTSGKER